MSVTIVSIYPQELSVEKPYSPTRGEGCHLYVLPSAEGKPFTSLQVEDAFEKVYYGESIGYRYNAIPADQIAQDLLFHWRENRIGNEGDSVIGVFIAAGKAPTKEELARAEENQTAHFERVINAADAAFKQGRHGMIPEIARVYAKWIGKEDYPWMKSMTRRLMKECPLCYAEIPEKALFCQVCRQNISKLPKAVE